MPRGLATRLLLTSLVAAATLVGWAGGAGAHSQLISSDPADGSSIPSPGRISLVFNQNVAGEFATVTLTRAPGTGTGSDPVTLRTQVTDQTLVATVPEDLQPTTDEEWTVAYRVVSADGHPITGRIDFTVTADETTPPTAAATTPAPTAPPATPSRTPAPSPEAGSAAPPPGSTPTEQPNSQPEGQSGGQSNGQVGATIVIGLLVATATGVTLLLLSRARRRPDDDH